jgi:hypothetical protein
LIKIKSRATPPLVNAYPIMPKANRTRPSSPVSADVRLIYTPLLSNPQRAIARLPS